MGLKFKVHPLFILLGLLMTVLGRGYDFLAYTVAVAIHEMGHSAAAERFGYILNEIKLMPYGAEIQGSLEGVKPSEEIKIAAVGPITNLVTAIIFTAVWWLIPSSYFFTQTFVYANIVNALFNLIPVFPLDGGRIMLCLLSQRMPHSKAIKIIKITGLVLGLVLIAGFIVSAFFEVNLSFCILGVFVFLCALAGEKKESYVRIYNRTYRTQNIKKGLEIREIAVSEDMPIGKIIKLFSPSYYYYVRVLDNKLNTVVTLSETQIEDMLGHCDYLTPVKEAVRSNKRQIGLKAGKG
ncbi:MAG TPA: M50 family metallopeptidase [Clostridia bacterium]